MSKASKTRKKEERKKKRLSTKMARKAQYAAWAAEGKNKRTKRSMRQEKSLVRTRRHALGACSNTGCTHCNPSIPSHPRADMKGGGLWRHLGK